MSAPNIITLGLGAVGTPSEIVTLGYSPSSALPQAVVYRAGFVAEDCTRASFVAEDCVRASHVAQAETRAGAVVDPE